MDIEQLLASEDTSPLGRSPRRRAGHAAHCGRPARHPGRRAADGAASAVWTAQTTWEGPLAGGTGLIRMGSGAAGELAVTWASRTGRADGKTSPEELVAAAHSACYAMALRLGEHQVARNGSPSPPPSPLTRQAASPTIVSSHVDVTARVPGLDKAGFGAVVGEASNLCPVSRLFAVAKITVDATLERVA